VIRKPYPKKSLGQNYLTDENIARNIVDAFDVNGKDYILEIGSGQGALTKFLLEKTESTIAVEIDPANCAILQDKFPQLNILNQDFLRLNLATLFGEEKEGLLRRSAPRNLRIIGNIPYNITSEIVFKLIDNRSIVSDAQLMMQEEVARRFVSPPGSKEYGIPSVFVQVFSKPGLLFKVSRNCFYPKPNVDSRIIYFDFSVSRESEIIDITFFKKFVKAAFSSRRKTLRNSLKPLALQLEKADFDFSRRAETLSIDEFILLSNVFSSPVR
jgi:16S rRNA (adenine1518-N6/adenine1519-N6)-dimethyltransferase